MTRIACVGITVQDRIYSLNNLPDGGENISQINIWRQVAARRQQQLSPLPGLVLTLIL